MRCKAWVVVSERRRKGSGSLYEHVKPISDAYERPQLIPLDDRIAAWKRNKGRNKFPPIEPAPMVVLCPKPPQPEAVRCGGEILAKVAAVDEPTYHDDEHYAALEITATCLRCKWTYHGPKVPRDQDELSALLTEFIAGLPD